MVFILLRFFVQICECKIESHLFLSFVSYFVHFFFLFKLLFLLKPKSQFDETEGKKNRNSANACVSFVQKLWLIGTHTHDFYSFCCCCCCFNSISIQFKWLHNETFRLRLVSLCFSACFCSKNCNLITFGSNGITPLLALNYVVVVVVNETARNVNSKQKKIRITHWWTKSRNKIAHFFCHSLFTWFPFDSIFLFSKNENYKSQKWQQK